MKRTAAGLFVTAALLLHTEAGRAAVAADDTPSLLMLDFSGCAAAPAADIRNMVSVELRRSVVLVGEPASASGQPGPTRVRVACQELRAEIHVDDPVTGESFPRVIDLSTAAPIARPHLLALSIVELLAASWLEFQRARQTENASANATAATAASLRASGEAPEAHRSDAGRSLRAAAVVATQKTGELQSWGAGAIIAANVWPHVGWLADIGVQHGERGFSLGSVTADTASVLVTVLGGGSFRAVSLRGGPGVRTGAAWMNGVPASPGAAVGGAVSGVWWGPVAELEGSLVIGGRLVLELTLEAGRVLRPVVATVQGADPVAIDGTWMRGTIGVGLVL